LFRRDPQSPPSLDEQPLTRREGEVLHLIGASLINKEIARQLNLCVAPLKHHVHNILHKLQVRRRSQAMRCVCDNPWIATWPLTKADPALPDRPDSGEPIMPFG
jgi:two-component system nitrate/nitrite response regulator NarL